MANWCVLPEDIMFSCILTRVPVKSIVRFKSVCKPWLELLSTPEFVKSHHAQFSSDPKNESLMILNSFDTSTALFYSTEKKLVIEHPYSLISYNGVIVGCCNGLICMVGTSRGGFVLWNPATRMSKFVQENSNNLSLGFGYDAEGGDFKVVRISENNEAEVYSVGSNFWTRIAFDFEFWFPPWCDLIVNGNPYWVVNEDYGSDLALCFDSTKLVFKTVPLPSFFQSLELECELVDLNGCLGVLVSNKKMSDLGTAYSSLDVWAFDESDQTWRKAHSLGRVEGNVSWFMLRLRNGKVVGVRVNGLFVYDPRENGRVDDIVIDEAQKSSTLIRVLGYTESLFDTR